ncbi:hypothetical protein [Mesobacillus foraminis]|jgi:hypothetical protein|uniref:Uncharacterized protein n=1 Tax=Mesobacillus foraminis TaxID=279826 RepID=A0A4R2BHW9_9BACI|nr:hypothetical protein [Mesobacillus foraminis]MBT2759125.1 hypothetical protein [Mesobacillus foraminis]TCN26163.1 hypothetical protein EV146_104271 [Mesobacillus foraminis]
MKRLRKPRKRFVVVVRREEQSLQIVIIAPDLKGMYRQLFKLYSHLFKENEGRKTLSISFRETHLSESSIGQREC